MTNDCCNRNHFLAPASSLIWWHGETPEDSAPRGPLDVRSSNLISFGVRKRRPHCRRISQSGDPVTADTIFSSINPLRVGRRWRRLTAATWSGHLASMSVVAGARAGAIKRQKVAIISRVKSTLAVGRTSCVCSAPMQSINTHSTAAASSSPAVSNMPTGMSKK